MQLYSIGDTAQKSRTTIETLRHYDRIGLLKPACVAAGSGYRYYSNRELLTLLIIQYCKRHGASLKAVSYTHLSRHPVEPGDGILLLFLQVLPAEEL